MVTIPGTRISVGLDAVIGLVPVAGDLFSAGLSGFLIQRAARLGAPRELLLRMAGNVAMDVLAGLIPVVGDFADIAIRANVRNLKLVENWLAEPEKARRQSRWRWVGLSGLVLLVSLGLFTLAWLVVQALNQLILA